MREFMEEVWENCPSCDGTGLSPLVRLLKERGGSYTAHGLAANLYCHCDCGKVKRTIRRSIPSDLIKRLEVLEQRMQGVKR